MSTVVQPTPDAILSALAEPTKPKTKAEIAAEEAEQLHQEIIALLGTPPDGLGYVPEVLPIGYLVLDHPDSPGIHADVAKLAESFTILGTMLHPPAVEQIENTPEGEPRYHVMAGRRRILAALHIGWTHVDCRIYAPPNEYVRGLIVASENMTRRNDWRVDVEQLHNLTRRGEVLTAPMLVAAGFKTNEIKPLLDLVALPEQVIDLITRGAISRSTANRIARLEHVTQRELALRLQAGEEWSPELLSEVVATLTKQITPYVPVSLQAEGQASTSFSLSRGGEVEPGSSENGHDDTLATLERLLVAASHLATTLASSTLPRERQLVQLCRMIGVQVPVIITDRERVLLTQVMESEPEEVAV